MQLRGTEALQLLSLAAIGDAVKMPLDDRTAPWERGLEPLYHTHTGHWIHASSALSSKA